jgi:extracellular factor (EF) 3-hydroxypalmitic acid methyl ester biosynthesis protein
MFHAANAMNTVSNGQGSGHAGKHRPATAPSAPDPKKKAPLPKPVAPPQPQSVPLSPDGHKSHVSFHTSEGVALAGVPLSMTRYMVTFELYNPVVIPQSSEALGGFKIILQEKAVYAGRAVVRNILDVGTKIICEAALDETAWAAPTLATGQAGREQLQAGFKKFIGEWQKSYRVLPEYKLVIADLQTFLSDLRLWLDQVEASIRSAPAKDQENLEIEAVNELRGPVVAALNNMFERFEVLADKIPKDVQAAHRAYGQRQLHPLLLCAPFIHRTYTKPLGFAGDYEMMNMIVRNKLEGSSLYAKLANQYLLDQIGPMAVRGRVGFLTTKIIDETSRISRQGRKAKIFCVACGPAWEAVNFVADHPLAERAEFELLDFSEETLRYTTAKMEDTKKKNHRHTQVKFIRNSVQNLLRGRSKPLAEYDLIYCSGLYDYLSDSVCKSLNTHLYDMLRPGGLLVVGNFAPNTPVRNFIEHFLEWFLIYRNSTELALLGPEQLPRESCVIRAEPTGTNIFLEARKPE